MKTVTNRTDDYIFYFALDYITHREIENISFIALSPSVAIHIESDKRRSSAYVAKYEREAR